MERSAEEERSWGGWLTSTGVGWRRAATSQSQPLRGVPYKFEPLRPFPATSHPISKASPACPVGSAGFGWEDLQRLQVVDSPGPEV